MTSFSIKFAIVSLLGCSIAAVAAKDVPPPGMVKRTIGGFSVYQHPDNLLVAKGKWMGIYDDKSTPPTFAMTRFNNGEAAFEVLNSAEKGKELYKNIHSAKFSYTVNCARQTMTLQKGDGYSGYFAEGRIVETVPGDSKEIAWDNGLLGVTAKNVCSYVSQQELADQRIFKLGFHLEPYIGKTLSYRDQWIGNANEKYEYFFMRSLPVTSVRPWVIYSMGRGKDLSALMGPDYSRYVSWGTQYEFDCSNMRARALQQAMSTDYFLGGVLEKAPLPLPFAGEWVQFDSDGKITSKIEARDEMFADEISYNCKLACPKETLAKKK